MYANINLEDAPGGVISVVVNYEGGFDSTEMEFCFRVFIDDVEYWFQLPLQLIEKIYLRQLDEMEVRLAEL